MPDFIRVFGAFPIARNDLGHIFADHEATARHETADEACFAAEAFARTAAYVAGVAFTRVIDPPDRRALHWLGGRVASSQQCCLTI
jgi:hypothetical protein